MRSVQLDGVGLVRVLDHLEATCLAALQKMQYPGVVDDRILSCQKQLDRQPVAPDPVIDELIEPPTLQKNRTVADVRRKGSLRM